MPRRYMSIGIDHGTTNSCIAVMGDQGPRVIKTFSGENLTPSAVYLDKRGRRLVGWPALEAMKCFSVEEGNGFTGYRIRIGQEERYEFTAARQVMTGPELGGIVIGELLRAYQEETGERPRAAVITVPAKFEHSASEGTRMAARLAGLCYAPQIHEPVAAALAYGFAYADADARWMVFDLGAGTLDVSLVMMRQGQVTIPYEGHAGDTRLGGRKFDRGLMAYVLTELRKRYALNGFSEKNPAYACAWGRLLLACENAKERLLQKAETVVELEGALCKDERGTPVKIEVPITRSQYEKLIAVDVERSVHACQLLLARNRLPPQDVGRLVLIGEATKTPYLRQVLADRLRIEVDGSQDPVTAVAIGAALYAATVEIPVEEDSSAAAVPGAAAKKVELTLEYERKSSFPTHCVIGRVAGSAVAAGGLTFEIRRTDDLWSSMPQPSDEPGLFSCDVLLIDEGQPRLSSFTTLITDRSGRLLVSQEEPQIWYPFPEGKARLANSLLVAVRGNETVELIKHGAELPASSKITFETEHPVRKGSREDILRFPVLEAVTDLLGYESSRADCNIHIGTLAIDGSDQRVTCDLPVGTDVEVEIHQDESREIRAVAYIPLLDEEFEVTFRPDQLQINDDLPLKFAGLKDELRWLEDLQKTFPSDTVETALDTVRRLDAIHGIETELAQVREGRQDAQYRSYRRILELAGTLNVIRDMQSEARLRLSAPYTMDLSLQEARLLQEEFPSDGIQVARLKRQIRMLRPAIEGTDIFELLAIERALRDSPENLEALDRLHVRLVNLTARRSFHTETK